MTRPIARTGLKGWHAALGLAVLLLPPALAGAAEPVWRPEEGTASEEYYWPDHADRHIFSNFTNVAAGITVVKLLPLAVMLGLTETHAWGNLEQYGPNFQNVVLPTAADGVGPFVELRCEPVRIGPASLSLEGLAGFLLYDRPFPRGGAIYDFNFRLGPSFTVRLTDRVALTAGGRWMHVSNGQGFNSRNPSYEAYGSRLGLRLAL